MHQSIGERERGGYSRAKNYASLSKPCDEKAKVIISLWVTGPSEGETEWEYAQIAEQEFWSFDLLVSIAP